MIGTDTRDVEQELLGVAILAPDITARIDLTADQFSIPMHGAIWEGIRALHSRGVQPTVPLIIEEAQAWGRIDHGVIVDLAGQGIATNVDVYATRVLDAYDKRTMLSIFDRGRQHVLTKDTDAETIRDDARTALDAVAKHTTRERRIWSVIESDVIDLIQNGGVHGLHTPWPDLDRYIDGLAGGRCYLVAARPGEGKSLMAQGFATHMANRHHKTVLFASLEMSEADLGLRIMAAESGVGLKTLMGGNLSEDQWQQVSTAQARVTSMPLIIDDTPNQTMGHIRAAAVDIVRDHDLGLIVIDYLQLIEPEKSSDVRAIEVGDISRKIKLLCKELNVPVVALAQLNREVLRRQDKRPMLGDLRESGSLEQDFDVVILMNKDDDTGELHVQVAKNRHGPQGNFDLQLWGHKATLRSVSTYGGMS